jgi:hypothetical protein
MEDGEGWRHDPTGRHQERYFRSPGIPTTRVRNDGVEANDEEPSDYAGTSAQTSGLVYATNPAPIPAGGITPIGTDLTGSTLVASYRALVTDTTSSQVTESNREDITSPPAVVVLREHNWWLIAAVCVLALLLVVTGVFAVQQHSEANRWMGRYHAEISNYHAEVHKDVSIYASLVSTQQRFTACVGEANRVFFDVAIFLHSGFLPSSSKSDSQAAAHACQSATQQAVPQTP